MESINTNADSSQVEQIVDDRLEKIVLDFNAFRENISHPSLSDDLKLEDLIDLYINNGVDNSYSSSQPNQNHCSEVQVTDDRLEKIVQDFNEFREKILNSSLSDDIELEDLIDLYINTGVENPYSTSQHTQSQFTELHEDFNKFEPMLPSNQVKSTSTNGLNFDTQIQESEMIVMEMLESTSQNPPESFPANSQTVSTNSHVELGSTSKKVTYIRHGEMNYSGRGSNILSSVLSGGNEIISDSVVKYFTRGMKFYQQMSGNGNAKRSNPRRKKVKRKYSELNIQVKENKN